MFNQALAANPMLIELAEEVSARGRAIEQLQAEVQRLQAEVQRLTPPAEDAP